MLADSPFADPLVVAGESAVAGLAGFLLAAQDEAMRQRLSLDANSVVMVVGTEGATDPVLYEQIVGRAPKQVTARAGELEAVQ